LQILDTAEFFHANLAFDNIRFQECPRAKREE
jgi:hypothetical protein